MKPSADKSPVTRDGDSRRRSLIPIREAAAIGSGAVALASVSVFAGGVVSGAAGAGLAILMLAIAIVDARQFIIPDRLNAAAFTLGVVNAGLPWSMLELWSFALQDVAHAILRGACLAAAFLAIRIGYRRLRHRDGMGLGDVKLAAVAGVWLDWTTIPVTIEIAVLAALAFYVMRQAISGQPLRVMARLPFGLFFAPAIWIGWLIEITLLGN